MIGDILKWYQACRIIGGNKDDGWPECLAIRYIAKLAFPNDEKMEMDFLDLLRLEIRLERLPTTGTQEFRSPRYASSNIPVANLALRYEWESDLIRQNLPDSITTEPTVSRQDFSVWTYRKDVPPGSPLNGWLEGIKSAEKPGIAVPNSVPVAIPQVYVSYAWGDDTPKGKQLDEIVDRLCETLSKSGFEVGRDKTHTKPGDSIKTFMQSLSKSPKIIAVISEKYLRSRNCMVYELFPAFRRCDFDRTEFREKVVALVLDDSVPLLKNRFELKEYWQSQSMEERKKLLIQDEDRRTGVDWDFVNHAEDMSKNLPNMLEIINDTLMARGFDEILKTEFREVIERLKVGNH